MTIELCCSYIILALLFIVFLWLTSFTPENPLWRKQIDRVHDKDNADKENRWMGPDWRERNR